MKAILLASAALVLGQIAMAQVTPAAATNVAGTYAYTSVTGCEAKLVANNGSIAMAQSGLIHAETGYVTFTPSSPGGASGTFVAASTSVEGGALRFNSQGFPWSTTTSGQQPAAPYSFTATTFTLNGNVAAMTRADMVGTGVHAVYKFVNLLRRSALDSNKNCLNTVTLIK